ncbi:MAG: neutral zinc metallopeptidase, partial [Paramuribaculum sp.]|nr:neutral zinc metallopeptidase [Paramuribaculum sp.]
MRLDGRRRSNNVQDKRGGSKSLALGGGIGAVIIAALITWISGGNPLDVLMSNSGSLFSGGENNTE